MTDFVIVSNNSEKMPHKLTVRGIEPMLCGIWDEIDNRLIVPCKYDIAQLLPHKYRKAFNRAQGFWIDKAARWDGEKQRAAIPHMELYDQRGKYLFSLYAYVNRYAPIA